MRFSAAIVGLLALAFTSGGSVSQTNSADAPENLKKARDANEYYAKRHPYYDRVDLSFSKFPIDTELPDIKHQLKDLDCGEYDDGCEAQDSSGNGLYFWAAYWEKDGKSGTDYILTIKTVDAADFDGRYINALGVGNARKKDAVINNVKKFLPGLEIKCEDRASGNVGPVECGGSIDPGWFQIGFDEQDNLFRLRFDAYSFT